MASLKRSQSERTYSRQRYGTTTNVPKVEQSCGVRKAWPKKEDEENGKIRQQNRNTLRRIVSYILKKLRLKRKNRRLGDLNEDDLVEDIECEISEGSQESIYYSVKSNATVEEIISLKTELKEKEKEIDSLRQRVKELETENSMRYSEIKGDFVFNDSKAINIHFGEDRTRHS